MDLAGQWAAPIMLVIVLIVAAVFAPQNFFDTGNLRSLSIQIAVLGVVSIGQTLVLLTRSIDMSVSAVMALGAVIVVQFANESTAVPFILLAFGVAAVIGLINGLLVTWRKVPPFVATFGMLFAVLGLRQVVTLGQASGTPPSIVRALSFNDLGAIPVPTGPVLWIGLTLIFILALRYTRFGRWIYSVGGNAEAARYAGIRINWVVIGAHVICSALALLAGLMLGGATGYVGSELGTNYNMFSISASVIGGTTFTGGRGNLLGTAAGVMLFWVLINLVVVLGLAINWQLVVQGTILVLAIALQGFRQHLLSR